MKVPSKPGLLPPPHSAQAQRVCPGRSGDTALHSKGVRGLSFWNRIYTTGGQIQLPFFFFNFYLFI